MIHVPRDPRTPAMPVFTEKSSRSSDGVTMLTKAEKDLEKATAYYGEPANFAGGKRITRESPPTFTAYKDDALKAALLEVFNHKCAYCEMPLGTGASPDVEHFRPKGAVETAGGRIQPGYYWLVTDWNNLLYSCQFCNRKQRHETQDEAGRVNLGKLDQFPLSDESLRVRSPEDSLEDEEAVRLLVQPCVDEKAEEQFRFDRRGYIYGATERGRVSLSVYALARMGLVFARNEQAFDLIQQIQNVRDATRNLARACARGDDPEEIEEYEGQLGRQLDNLKRFFRRRSPYLGMKRSLVRSAAKAGALDDLTRAGLKLDLLAVPA